jgi:hypothetical protein
MSVDHKRLPTASKATPPAWALTETNIVPKPATVSARNNFFIYSDTSVFVFPIFFTDAWCCASNASVNRTSAVQVASLSRQSIIKSLDSSKSPDLNHLNGRRGASIVFDGTAILGELNIGRR